MLGRVPWMGRRYPDGEEVPWMERRCNGWGGDRYLLYWVLPWIPFVLGVTVDALFSVNCPVSFLK